jgi:PPOX class probable F420-dependent enzyme
MSTITRTSQVLTWSPLLDQPVEAVLTTICANGRLQCTPVWFLRDGTDVLFSTMREFAKARRLRANPAATLLAVDPGDTNNWVELRGRVRLEETDAVRVNDDIAERYTGRRPYFGGVVQAELAAIEHPITCRLTPATATTQPAVPGLARPMSRIPPLPPAPGGGCRHDAALPADHLDLLDLPVVAALATRLPDGSAQTQPVWFARDGNDLLVNTSLERRKGRNLLADPRATLLVIDPDGARWVEVRADVELSTHEAEAQLDELTRRYTRYPSFYGHVYPAARRASETRVVARLHPRKIQISSESGAGADWRKLRGRTSHRDNPGSS